MKPLARLLAFALPVGMLAACSEAPSSRYQGYVEADYTYVASPMAGRLAELAVARGQRVAVRDPLYRIEATDIVAARDAAAEDLRAAQAQLADLQTGKRPRELDVIRDQLAQAQAEAGAAALRFARDEKQVDSGAISRQQYDDNRATLAAAQARVRQLQAELDVAQLPARSEQIRAQAAQAQAAQAALAQAEWRLAEMRQVAPVAATVVDTLYRPGEWVLAGRAVVKLLSPADIKLRFYVPETEVATLKLGQSLSAECDGCAGPVAAVLSFIAPAAEYTPPVIYSNQTRAKLVFMVEARPAAQDASRLHPGQPISVTLR